MYKKCDYSQICIQKVAFYLVSPIFWVCQVEIIIILYIDCF